MSKEEVKHHKAVRGAYRGHCNQDIKRAQRLMADTEVINNTELKAIAERLSRRLDEIKAMDCTILNALWKGRRNKRRDRSSIDVPRRYLLLDSEN